MHGGLYDPLGSRAPQPIVGRRSRSVLVAGGLLATGIAVLGLIVVLRGGDERGEPRAVVTIEKPPPAVVPPPITAPAVPPAQPAAPSAVAGAVPPSPAAANPDADVEVQNGVRIIRMRPPLNAPAGQAAAPASAPRH